MTKKFNINGVDFEADATVWTCWDGLYVVRVVLNGAITIKMARNGGEPFFQLQDDHGAQYFMKVLGEGAVGLTLAEAFAKLPGADLFECYISGFVDGRAVTFKDIEEFEESV